MSEFYKRFLMDDSRRLNPDSDRYVALAAFGKHPGWDDHVEDLGLETDSLNFAKQVLYVQGVGGQIDTGAWEKLKEEQRLATFNHAFIWQRGDQLLLGRMWSSSDGKGRTRYPMILCAHFIGVPLAWVVQFALPKLEDAEKSCRETKSAEDVRTILNRARNSLRNSINDPGIENARDKGPGPSALNQFVSSPAFGPNQEGWFRILYWLHSQEKAFGPGKFNLKGDLSGLRPQQFRVPPGLPNATAAVPLWTRFLSMHVDRQSPALLVWPGDREWLDITLGEPSSHEFFCLRAERQTLPMATEIPYDFDQVFRQDAAQELTAFQHGSTRRPAPTSTLGAQPAKTATNEKPGWFKSLTGKLMIGGILLVVVGGAAVMFMHGGGSSDEKKPDTKTVAIRDENPAPPAGKSEAELAAEKEKAAEAEKARLKAETEAKAQEQARIAAEARRREELDRQHSEAAAKAKVQAEKAATEKAAADKAEAEKAAAAKAAEETARLKAEAEARAKASVPATSSAPTTTVATSTPATSTPAHPAVQSSGGPHQKSLTNGIGMVLLWVPGLPDSGDGGWVGKYEVRQTEYQKLTDSNPSKFLDNEQPVEYVSWQEAMDFCRKLNSMESAASRLPAGFTYALPTRDQWDFFVGNATFETGTYENAITSRNQKTIRASPTRVGTMEPNQFGLYDVLGNVWEWCIDGDGSEQKALKGGAYNNVKTFQFRPLEKTTVRRMAADSKSPDAGFRCVVVAGKAASAGSE